MTIPNKTISSWVRQARYRAKKHNIYSDLSITDVQTILAAADRCAYCGRAGEVLDCPFPLKDGGPNVPANVLLCCKNCKTLKNNNDLVWMYSSGKLSEEIYLALLEILFSRRGGEHIKTHVRRVTGMAQDDHT